MITVHAWYHAFQVNGAMDIRWFSYTHEQMNALFQLVSIPMILTNNNWCSGQII